MTRLPYPRERWPRGTTPNPLTPSGPWLGVGTAFYDAPWISRTWHHTDRPNQTEREGRAQWHPRLIAAIFPF